MLSISSKRRPAVCLATSACCAGDMCGADCATRRARAASSGNGTSIAAMRGLVLREGWSSDSDAQISTTMWLRCSSRPLSDQSWRISSRPRSSVLRNVVSAFGTRSPACGSTSATPSPARIRVSR
jgi:hypothetical protein